MSIINYLKENLSLEEDQEFTSKDTSRSQIAALHKLLMSKGIYQDNQLVLDYGGGKYDLAKNFVESNKNIKFLVYDPFNRIDEHNKEVLSYVKENGGADIITLTNVLNVIKEKQIRINILNDIKAYLKGKLYISVYNAPRKENYKETEDYVGQQTIKGWQNSQPLSFYVPEVKSVFNDISYNSNYIVAS